MSKAFSREVAALGTALVKVQTALATIAEPTPAQNFTRTATRSPAYRQTLFGGTTLAKRAQQARAASLGAGHTLFGKYSPDQPRDDQGQWTEGGGGGTTPSPAAPAGSNWRGTAATIGGVALLAGTVGAALAVRNPAAVARALIGGSRAVDRHTGNIVNRIMFGGGGVSTRTTVGAVSRSRLEAGAYNINNAGKSMTPALTKRFGDADIIVKRVGDNTVTVTVKSKGLTDKIVNQMHGTGNTNLLKDKVYFSAIVDKKVGNVVLVESLYAPNTEAGKLFTQKAFSTVRDLAVANKADAITTPAGWAMSGFLWPNAGFQLLGAGTPPISLPLRVAGVWKETAITAEAVRAIVEMRAKELFATSRIDRASYGKVLAQLDDINWGPDSAAIISNMNRKVNIEGIKLIGMPHTTAAREIRGDVTLGKALLAHTNGTYILPKHLYERMFTINKRLSKYSPDQPRDEEGQWTEGGGSAAGASVTTTTTTKPEGLTAPTPVVSPDAPKRSSPWDKALMGIGVAGTVAFLVMRQRAQLMYVPVKAISATTGFGRSVPLFTDGHAPNAVKAMLAAVDKMPLAHYEALRKSGMRFVAVNNMGAVRGNMSIWNVYHGFYHPVSHALVIPEKTIIFGIPTSATMAQRTATALHEMAHALDFAGGQTARLTNKLRLTMSAELSNMVEATRRANGATKFDGWMNNYRLPEQRLNEVFAEAYAARYLGPASSARHFGSLVPHSDMAKLFPKTMDEIGKLKDLTPSTYAQFEGTMMGNLIQGVGSNPDRVNIVGLPARSYFSS